MIAKLCTHAPDRATAIDSMSDALDSFTLDGIRHNIPFLAALMAHPRWREGRLSTAFIAEEFPGGFQGATPSAEEWRILAAVAASAGLIAARKPTFEASDAAHAIAPAVEWVIALDRAQAPVTVEQSAPGAFRLSVGETLLAVETDWKPGERTWRGTIDGVHIVAQVARIGAALRVSRRSASALARLMTPRTAALAALMPEKKEADTSKTLLCPMPGLVVSIAVAEGQTVAPGETLATVEAMKMENVLRAERRATIARILAKPGDSLAVDAVIMEFS
jgi:propionyl-CoA carboxylase alpha subunit